MRHLHAWHELPALTADDFAQIIGQDLSVVDDQPDPVTGNVHAATLSLFAAVDELEIRLSVIVEDTMLDWFKETLLGDSATDEEATQDALRELANTTGGCFKRAALAEGIMLTTGLPEDDPCPAVSERARRFSLNAGSKRIVIVAQLCDRSHVRIQAAHLREGMVPLHDVYAPSGVLLVAGGSRLTQTTVANLMRNLSPGAYLDVCAPN